MATQQWQSQDTVPLPHGSSYMTVTNTTDNLSEKTVEMDTGRSPIDPKKHQKRHLVRKDEEDRSIGNQAVPSYMASTQSAKAKSRGHVKAESQSPLPMGGRLRVQTRHNTRYSPDSSWDDQTPPIRGRNVGKKEHARMIN